MFVSLHTFRHSLAQSMLLLDPDLTWGLGEVLERGAMMSVEVSIEISKATDEVFSYVATPTHAFVWRSTLMERIPPLREAIRVGSTFCEQSKLLDHILETTYEVIEWIPPQRVTYKSIVGAVPSLVCLRFASTAGGTRFTMRVEQALDLLFPQKEVLALRATQRIMHVDLHILKDVLENGSP